MNQPEIDKLSEALREQGLTWNQTNFAIALVRNAQGVERERCAVVCGNQYPYTLCHSDQLAASNCSEAIRNLK